MLRTVALAASLAALALSPTPAAASPARAQARRARPAPPVAPLSAVLARTFKAYGGVDAILEVGAVRSVGAVSSGDAEGLRVERTLALPDRYRSSFSLAGVEHESVLLAGARAFRNGAEVTGLVRADQIRLEALRAFVPATLARHRGELQDDGELGRGAARIRRVRLPLREDATLTFDIEARSGRVLRAVSSVGGRDTLVTFRRFRMVSGVLFPFAEDVEAAEGTHTVELSRIELLPATAVKIEPP